MPPSEKRTQNSAPAKTQQNRAQPQQQRRTQPVSERTMPHNLEAERSVLGAILVNPEAYEEIADRLDATDFFRDAHRRIFLTLEKVLDDGVVIDLITVKDQLMKTGELDEVGGPAYLASLSDGMPRSANIVHYAEIVREKARLRDAIHTANKLLAASYLAENPSREIVAEAAESLLDLSGAATGGKPILLGDMMASCMASLETKAAAGTGVTGVATGFAQLDEMTAGLHPANLFVIGARSSQGKTALVLNIARNVAQALPVLMFSLEMAKAEIFERMLATESRVDSHRLRTGYLTDGEWTRIANAMGALTEMRMYIDDDANVGVREIRARSRQMKKDAGLGLIVVDYLQLMKSSGKFDTRSQEVGSFSRGLKRVAKELKVPLIALSQLSRASEAGPGRKARRPQMSDLRESGDIEADADVVLLIYRPEPKDNETPYAELIISKQRNGPTGTVKVTWDAASVTFDSTSIV
jgi:replicative DNA helicase